MLIFSLCPLLSFLANDFQLTNLSTFVLPIPALHAHRSVDSWECFRTTLPPSCLELSGSSSRSSFHPGSETSLKEFWHRKEHETSQSKRLTLEVGKLRFRSGLIAQCYCGKLNTPRPQGPCLPCAPLFVAPVEDMELSVQRQNGQNKVSNRIL